MAELSTLQRKRLPKTVFGEPGQRAYPMPDKAHAANAKARAHAQYNKGKLSKAKLARIDAMANTILGAKRG